MTDNKELGLYGKYYVERTDGKPIDDVIVLELKDPKTWPALMRWADSLEDDQYYTLATDVREMVLDRINGRPV